MSDFNEMVHKAAKAQAAHALGFGLNTWKAFLIAWLTVEGLIGLFMIVFTVCILLYAMAQSVGWWLIPIAIILVNVFRFAHAYGKARRGEE